MCIGGEAHDLQARWLCLEPLFSAPIPRSSYIDIAAIKLKFRNTCAHRFKYRVAHTNVRTHVPHTHTHTYTKAGTELNLHSALKFKGANLVPPITTFIL